MKILFATILLVSSTFAADEAALARARAACGPVDIRFDVTASEDQHPTAQPEPEKALVYFIQDGEFFCVVCSTTTRVGVDGKWVGANDGNSYFYVSVAPGEHHLCTDQQTRSEDDRRASLASFTAEPGKTYYFRARVIDRASIQHGAHDWRLDLDPINNDEGQLMVASSRFSIWHMKK